MAADDYEKTFMAGGEALFVERVRNKRASFGVPAGAAMSVLGGVAFAAQSGSILPAVVSATVGVLLIGGLGMFLAFARNSVTREHLHIQLGLLGPKIPIASITSAEVVTTRFELGASTYLVGGTGIVRITHTKGGKKKVVLIGSNDAPGLVAAIERARGGEVAARLRVAEAEPLTAEDEAAEAEAEADEAARTEKSQVR